MINRWNLTTFIISSGMGVGTMDANDFCAFMMPYFSPTAFSGFKNDRKGFYSVYGEVFSEIAKKEKYVHVT